MRGLAPTAPRPKPIRVPDVGGRQAATESAAAQRALKVQTENERRPHQLEQYDHSRTRQDPSRSRSPHQPTTTTRNQDDTNPPEHQQRSASDKRPHACTQVRGRFELRSKRLSSRPPQRRIGPARWRGLGGLESAAGASVVRWGWWPGNWLGFHDSEGAGGVGALSRRAGDGAGCAAQDTGWSVVAPFWSWAVQ